jgi:hypothetical protein
MVVIEKFRWTLTKAYWRLHVKLIQLRFEKLGTRKAGLWLILLRMTIVYSNEDIHIQSTEILHRFETTFMRESAHIEKLNIITKTNVYYYY